MKRSLLAIVLLSCIALDADAQQWLTSGTNIYNSNTTGNVGIGTATPSSRLHVFNSSGNTFLTIDKPSSASEGAIQFSRAGSALFYLWNDDATDALKIKATGETDANPRVEFPLANKNILMALSGGNVGIGTATPSTKLHIYGSTISSISDLGFNEAFRITRKGISGGQQEVSMGMFLSKYDGTDGNSKTRADFRLSDIGSPANSYGTDLSTISPVMSMLGNGNVGIGTNTPVRKLEVNGDVSVGSDAGSNTGYGASLHLLGASVNGDPFWLSRYNKGANASELRVNIGDDYGQADDMFVVGTSYWSDGQWYPHLAVQASGNVGIGTTSPDAKLAVKGQVHAQEVKVDLNGATAPDYVFEKDYALPSLESLKTYIDQNKHLPEVPSAKEMEANGINLSEMNMLLLKKVEELTLYVIEQQKQINELKNNRK